MKYVFFLLLCFLFLFPNFGIAASPTNAEPLLPESLAARSELAVDQKLFTVFLEEDDPVKLTELLNNTNDEYAQKGWAVFSITSYVHNGDMDGMFVTYQKGLIPVNGK